MPMRPVRRPIQTLAVLALTSAACADTLFVRASAPPGGDGLSWQTAFQDLRSALSLATEDPSITEIWVAAGTYRPDRGQLNRDDSFILISGVALYGGFAGNESDLDDRDPDANPTILSGDLQGDDQPGFGSIADNSRHVITAQGVDDTAIIDGFVIAGGNADFEGEDLLGGGGMFVVDASPRIRNCHFESNAAGQNEPDVGGFGGALYIAVGRMEIENCTFAKNRADNGGAIGILTLQDDLVSITITGCNFDSNSAEPGIGGAIYSAASVFPPSDQTLVIRGCTFTNNTAEFAGAIADFNSPELLITDTRFIGNTAGSAGVLWHAQTAGPDLAPAVIRSCLFDSNAGSVGPGGLLFEAADAQVEGCLFVANSSVVGVGGAIRVAPYTFGNGGELDVWNCIFSGNSAGLGGALGTFRATRVSIISSTFTANDGFSGGGAIAAASPMQIANSILWGNTAGGLDGEPAQIFHDPGFGPLTIDFTDIEGLTGNLGGQGNIGADPAFTDADGADNQPGTSDDDVSLTLQSPAIDAADNARLPADTLDLDADGNTSEALPLDQAGNARRSDIPGVIDTGNGQAPITDMGALEAQGGACYADCTEDGSLDLFDFLCFVNAFNESAPYADCDASDAIDFFDFLCFSNAFNEGC
jgi:hypothetical protein